MGLAALAVTDSTDSRVDASVIIIGIVVVILVPVVIAIRRGLEFPGFENGLPIWAVEPGRELRTHGHRVETPVVAAAVFGELAGLERRLAPQVGPVQELHHLLVLYDFVAEGKTLGAGRLEEGLLLFA